MIFLLENLILDWLAETATETDLEELGGRSLDGLFRTVREVLWAYSAGQAKSG